jgi:hypothetical protein
VSNPSLFKPQSQVALVLPSTAIRVAYRRGENLGFGFFRLRLDQSIRQMQVGQNRPEECDGVSALNEQGREILDIEIADYIGLILDIDPDEALVRVTRRKRGKGIAVLCAGAAPCGAQARNHPGVIVEELRNFGAVMGF